MLSPCTLMLSPTPGSPAPCTRKPTAGELATCPFKDTETTLHTVDGWRRYLQHKLV
jgi:hypothetical protein